MEREGLNPEILNAKNHTREAQIISQAGKKGAITIATNMAGRGVDIILGGNPSSKEEQEEIKALGGLHVIGTARHEARRIDNQLRGRSGRQGDPGSSQFYVSAEDDLLRIFGGDRMKMLMGRLRLPEDTPIQNGMVSKSLESAQKKVEGNNFDIRKHLVEYDDVINKHREAIYKRRREILEIHQEGKEEELSERIKQMVKNEISSSVSFYSADTNIKDWNVKEIFETVKTIFKVNDSLLSELEEMKENKENLKPEEIRKKIDDKLCKLAEDNYLKLKEDFKGIGVNFFDVEKGILIKTIDNLWIEHLETINYLRQGVGLNSYGQRDPLVEYKKESFRLFKELEDLIQKQIVYSIYKTATALEQRAQQIFSSPSLIDRAKNFSAPAKHSKDSSSSEIASVSRKPRNEEGEKVGRNDPCPCGSGKKYKKCCGK